ncbi:MAG TPA: outer membrane lipoprotein carrier protein LolA [Cyclobacteriaceae bacterium]|nr:outer membrane lipoprotein carrier protein LolA [Cyclobacteriaceae bacterium]
MNKFLILLALATSFSGALNAQKDPNALKILDTMSEKYKKMDAFRANFTYELFNETTDTKESEKGQILVMGDKYKLTTGQLEKYNDGTTVWTYYQEFNEVNIENYMPGESELSPSYIFNAYKKDFKFGTEAELTFGARQVHVIRLEPENPDKFPIQFQWLKVFIDKADYTLWGWQTLDKTGNTYTISINGFDPFSGATDAMFRFDESKHPGVYISDLRDNK